MKYRAFALCRMGLHWWLFSRRLSGSRPVEQCSWCGETRAR